MRTAPRPTSDDLNQQYEELLAEGLKRHDDYLRWLEQANDWERGGKKDIAAGLRADLAEHESAILDALRIRVQLLRKIDGMSDVNPMVHMRQASAAATVTSVLNRTGDVAGDEDDAVFFDARKSLAESKGYAIEEDAGDWLTVSRNGVVLEMKLSREPTAKGVTGNDCIEEIHVSAEVAGSSRTVSEYRPSDHSLLPSADPKVQVEIDRAVAVFG